MGQRPLWIHVDELRAALEAINYTPEEGDDSLHKWPKHRLFATAHEIMKSDEAKDDGRADVIRQHFQAASKRRQHIRVEKMSTENAGPPVELSSNSGNFSAEDFFADLIAGYLLSKGEGYDYNVVLCGRILALTLTKLSSDYLGGRNRDD